MHSSVSSAAVDASAAAVPAAAAAGESTADEESACGVPLELTHTAEAKLESRREQTL